MVEDGYADVPLIVETAQAFDTHHVALLLAAVGAFVYGFSVLLLFGRGWLFSLVRG